MKRLKNTLVPRETKSGTVTFFMHLSVLEGYCNWLYERNLHLRSLTRNKHTDRRSYWKNTYKYTAIYKIVSHFERLEI